MGEGFKGRSVVVAAREDIVVETRNRLGKGEGGGACSSSASERLVGITLRKGFGRGADYQSRDEPAKYFYAGGCFIKG